MIRIFSHPSLNFDNRKKDSVIDKLILHYTGMPTSTQALQRLCDTEAKVSAHYLVDEKGNIYQLVDEQNRAWHAGESFWRGEEALNHSSIGIEIANPGHEWGYKPYPKIQMDAVLNLCQDICSRRKIPKHLILAHSDIAPERKEDPGELFDWQFLSKNNIGLWHDYEPTSPPVSLLSIDDFGPKVEKLQQRLAKFGYRIENNGQFDTKTAQVVTAFKRHYCRDNVNSIWDSEADACLTLLEEKINQ